MRDQIVLPSGNVVPALSEQALYLELRRSQAHSRWPRRYNPYQRQPRKLRRWDISSSGESSFIQHGIESKELDQKELNRRAWREEKQFNRDRIRGSHYWGYRSKKWACKSQSRSDRRRNKELIRNEEFDQFFTHDNPRDRWMWD